MTQIQPLIIYADGHRTQWVNPDIASIASFEDDPDYDNDVHRIWINNKKGDELIVMIAKAPVLNKLWDTATEENNWQLNDVDVQAALDEILMQLDDLLISGTWSHGGVQFASTEAGVKIGKLYKKRTGIRFSPDCCVHVDDGEWHYST